MRLLTHNMLRCNVKGVRDGFPLTIEVDQEENSVERTEADFNAEFLVRILPKLSWPALLKGARELGIQEVEQLPESVTEAQAAGEDEAFLKNLHTVLLEVRLIKGALICPETGRRFPVTNSIPNMLLNEDEV